MANKQLWLPEAVGNLLTTELNNVADGAIVVDGADYANAVNKFRWADFFFFGTFDAPCNASAIVELHIFYKLDGTNYGDGEDGDVADPVAGHNSLHGTFSIGANAGPIYQQMIGVQLSPFNFRAGLKLNTGQDLTAVDTHWLKMYPYSEELQ